MLLVGGLYEERNHEKETDWAASGAHTQAWRQSAYQTIYLAHQSITPTLDHAIPFSPNFTTMGLEFFSRKVVVALALTAQLTAGFTNNGKSSMHDRFD